INFLINNGGTIGTGGNISLTLDGNLSSNPSGGVTLLVSNPGAQIQTGGNIASDTFVNILLGDTTIGGSLTAFIDNSDGKIGGKGGSTTDQINGKLSVGARINVLGTLTTTSS